MKKLLTILAVAALAFVAATHAAAYVISPEVAQTTARNLIGLDDRCTGIESPATVTTISHNGVPAYYLIEYSAGGWAIVAAQSSARPLIAYNPTGQYAAPEPMQAVLRANAQRIVDHAALDADASHPQWSMAQQRKPAADANQTPDIAPLITVHLNQSAPYNASCPTVGGERCLVGCVAVGMGQAMMVARYPERPVGQYS